MIHIEKTAICLILTDGPGVVPVLFLALIAGVLRTILEFTIREKVGRGWGGEEEEEEGGGGIETAPQTLEKRRRKRKEEAISEAVMAGGEGRGRKSEVERKREDEIALALMPLADRIGGREKGIKCDFPPFPF